MKAFEHLKLSQLITSKNVYKRVLQYFDGYENAITKGEFEQFEKSYIKSDTEVRKAIDKIKTANKFKTP